MTNIVRIWKSIYRELTSHIGTDGRKISEFINLAVLYTLVNYVTGRIDMRELRKCYGLLRAGFSIEEIARELGLAKIEKRLEKREEKREEARTGIGEGRPVSPEVPIVIEQLGGENVDHVLLRDNPWIAIIRSRYATQG